MGSYDRYELNFSMLGEAAIIEITHKQDARGIPENKVAAKKGGKIAGYAREKLEIETNARGVSAGNYLTESEGQKRQKDKK